MHKKEFLGRTGKFTSEYRSTYTLSYRYEMPDRVFYFTEEAVNNVHSDKWIGHVVTVIDNCKLAGSVSERDKVLIKSAIARGTLEKYHTVIVFEYEVDYE
jgi:hypothetical protein